MLRRLVLLLLALVLVLVPAGYLLRTWSVERSVRSHDGEAGHRDVLVLAALLDQRLSSGGIVDPSLLRPIAGPDVAIRYHPATGPDVEVRGSGYTGSLDTDPGSADVWSAARTADGGYVLLSEDAGVVRATAWQSRSDLVLLLLMTVVVATLVGLLLAGWYTRPFRRLARAASSLRRGRFELDLPRRGAPEVRALAEALDASAQQLQDRLAGEDEFARRASHALRTPLTGLRWELEEAAVRDDLPEHVATALARSLRRVDQLDEVTGELIAAARGRALVAGATLPLEALAGQVAQRWADELDAHGRELTAQIEGGAATTYTPGPVEQILELLLVDVVHRSRGAVRIGFAVGTEAHLRITVRAASARSERRTGGAPMARARAVATALGGRLEGEYAADGVEIVLPRR
ncbi:HAMP domain-containing sensor histidine kinase [Nocardioides sp. BP30]|uniref:sensor histidine kinase n=1 Tax=Nocardioides sp. BP30 TaxID=3036374 RepID=UPI0024694B0E|nr:HAMP domain-containing sensor histidine kinase [Nocardioides sp. BP30]WGL53495.1 HAMP domain-containing sensor histidine kinase [Nocardioides sp. BP30]